MTDEVAKFHETPAESFRPKFPPQKSERELKLEALLKETVCVVGHFLTVVGCLPNLNPEDQEFRFLIEENDRYGRDFIKRCGEVLGD